MSAADTPLIAIAIRTEHDVVTARRRGRQLAALAGLDRLEQTRFQTAVSEIARTALEHAGGGETRFLLAEPPLALVVEIEDHGPGLAAAGSEDAGLGLVGARRLMDDFATRSGPAGTVIRCAKHLPAGLDRRRLGAAIREAIAADMQPSPIEEMRSQNHEMLRALETLRQRELELTQLNRELEATNRGVVALYAELDQRAEQLRAVSDLKSQFLSNMTHEFRTPLNSIIALSRMLLDRVDGPLSPEQDRQVDFIRKGAIGLAEMVDDLLDLAKVESGKLEVSPAEFSLTDMLDTLRGMLKPLLATNHAVSLVIEPPPEIRLFTDERKLAQVVRNLIANGLKFTERGEVRVTARLTDAQTLALAVADTGIGISDADQRLLFTEFSQVKGPLQRRVKGTGLGLSLSRRLAELMGGTLAVDSRVGRGSTFTVRLPIRYSQTATAEPPSAAPVTVLHVEDDEAFRYLLRSAIGGRCALIGAADGETGLRLLRSEHPRAVILDLDLPGLDGFGLLAAVRADAAMAALPVVVLSSYAPPADDPRLAGCCAVIDKNLTADPGTIIIAALRRAGLPLAA